MLLREVDQSHEKLRGNWWDAGKYIGFGPAYVMVDLFADGTFRHDVVFWE